MLSTHNIKLYKTAFYQCLFLVGYNVIEGVVSTILGAREESLTLFGFGADSFIEVISGVGILHMITRIRMNPESSRDKFEKTALKITGFAFYALVVALVTTSIYNFVTDHRPESTMYGVVISAISIVVMGAFIHFQTKVGKALDSKAILADVECTKVCIYMSIVLLLGSALYELTAIPHIDSAGAIILAWFSLKEGRECFEKARNNKICTDCC